MSRVIKVFCSGNEQAALVKVHAPVERYSGFVLLRLTAKTAKMLARQFPIEDITDLYTIRAGGRTIDTARPRVDVAGKLHAHPAYRDVKRLAPGKHHYLVQFIGPIKSAWLKAVKKAGGVPRVPYENFAYVVRATDRQRAGIAGEGGQERHVQIGDEFVIGLLREVLCLALISHPLQHIGPGRAAGPRSRTRARPPPAGSGAW